MFEGNGTKFTGHLFVEGLPLVVNYQVMEQRLKSPRITNGQRLSAEISLNDEAVSRIVTLADHDDAEPLLVEFVPDGQGRFVLNIKTVGRYFNWPLRIDQETRHLLVDKNVGSHFKMETYAGKLKSLADLPSNPASVTVISAERDVGLFLDETKQGLKYFMDKSPNKTGHDAFNPTPAVFVLRADLSSLAAVA